MKSKYINPFTDFGFKKIFGEEASKPLLLDFLNALLPESGKIVDLTFKNSEQLAETEEKRRAVYNIYCENERGEKFIVELQKAKQNYFRERTIYYATFPIREQGEKGDWDFNLKAVYCIGILDFTFGNANFDTDKDEYEHTIKLKNQNGKTFYEKLTFIYFEMPNFRKTEEELKTRLDKWLYFIKHLEDFQVIPNIIADEVFQQAFDKAELAKLGSIEMEEYERSLKVFRDLNGAFTTAHDEGKVEVKTEIASFMKAENETIEKIIKYTGLTKEEIEKL
ncbi:MAG: Rpn family recombination-promoting nuclease/putative transposase [Bacteroidetes bacterium]|nr:Rpn family recombination-promoting nuclease/putative transposase [Bacteroidota bacterium]